MLATGPCKWFRQTCSRFSISLGSRADAARAAVVDLVARIRMVRYACSLPPEGSASMNDLDARKILGIWHGFPISEDELKRAWKAAAMRLHPDLGGSSDEFILAGRAVAFLRSSSVHGSPSTSAASGQRGAHPSARPSALAISGPSLPSPRQLDPGYAARQRALEEAYGHLGDWGRGGDGLYELWVRLYGRRRKG